MARRKSPLTRASTAFIVASHKDKQIAVAIGRKLRLRGIGAVYASPRFDPTDIANREIREKIDESLAVVAVVTKDTTPNIHRMIGYASGRNKIVLSLIEKGVPPKDRAIGDPGQIEFEIHHWKKAAITVIRRVILVSRDQSWASQLNKHRNDLLLEAAFIAVVIYAIITIAPSQASQLIIDGAIAIWTTLRLRRRHGTS